MVTDLSPKIYLWIYIFIIFVVAPCILISSESFIYHETDFISDLENIKIHIKTAPTETCRSSFNINFSVNSNVF